MNRTFSDHSRINFEILNRKPSGKSQTTWKWITHSYESTKKSKRKQIFVLNWVPLTAHHPPMREMHREQLLAASTEVLDWKRRKISDQCPQLPTWKDEIKEQRKQGENNKGQSGSQWNRKQKRNTKQTKPKAGSLKVTVKLVNFWQR